MGPSKASRRESTTLSTRARRPSRPWTKCTTTATNSMTSKLRRNERIVLSRRLRETYPTAHKISLTSTVTQIVSRCARVWKISYIAGMVVSSTVRRWWNETVLTQMMLATALMHTWMSIPPSTTSTWAPTKTLISSIATPTWTLISSQALTTMSTVMVS
jgi:hypothetical protein